MSAAGGVHSLGWTPAGWSAAAGTGLPAPVAGAGRAWMAQAACRGTGVAGFFGTPEEMTRARAQHCAGCPVQEICLWWAIGAEAEVGYRFGIWGGVGPAVRAQITSITGVGYARARLVAAAGVWAYESVGSQSRAAVA